jgi:EamA domain-containing membrane protein RarD
MENNLVQPTLSLIAISIPLFIVVLPELFFKEKVSNIKIVGIAKP